MDLYCFGGGVFRTRSCCGCVWRRDVRKGENRAWVKLGDCTGLFYKGLKLPAPQAKIFPFTSYYQKIVYKFQFSPTTLHQSKQQQGWVLQSGAASTQSMNFYFQGGWGYSKTTISVKHTITQPIPYKSTPPSKQRILWAILLLTKTVLFVTAALKIIKQKKIIYFWTACWINFSKYKWVINLDFKS